MNTGYVFNIQDEFERIIHDYPQAAERLVVRHLSVDAEGAETVTSYYSKNLAVPVLRNINRQDFIRWLHTQLKDNTELSKKMQSSTAGFIQNTLDIVTLLDHEPFLAPYHAQDLPYAKAFVFYHEMGHLLIEESRPSFAGMNLKSESLADAFATIRMLQTFDCAENILRIISWQRALDAARTGFETHVTTRVIDKILEDSKKFDFKILNPAQTLRAAESYTLATYPKSDVGSGIKKYSPMLVQDMISQVFGDSTKQHTAFKGICQIAFKAEDAFSFYLGARLVKPLLITGEARKFNVPEEQLNTLREIFAQKSTHHGFHEMAEDFKASQSSPSFKKSLAIA